jgi:ribosome-associated protein
VNEGGPAPEDLVARSGVRVPARALSWRFSRSGGPGGQHVNTSDTRVELVSDLTHLAGPEEVVARVRERLGDEVRVVAASERSQRANREEATRRLLRRIEAASRAPRPRRATRPTASSVEARLEEKRRRSRRKADRHPRFDE